MSTEPFVGEIKILAFNFAPRGYMTCQGQIIGIQQNTALFSLIGTYYGGNGQTTFALPNLQGRMPIGQGQSSLGASFVMGQALGTTSVSILTANMPAHVHTLNGVSVKIKASTANADETSPNGNFPAVSQNPSYSGNGATNNIYSGGTAITGTTDITGSGIPIDVSNPYLTINFSIATQGIFPSRN
ncbi:tail fiber protein [Flavobacterium sp. F-65]|jgi:microcystin-dependent protein|uniref:Tail fiber protein n=1 Tax=Flavobacterium pisciphilum TaxID=2893755 RepID=A0ABS8MRR6_9FLAO|nr:tail fiber protein [Flavobacterium sp. F-65]MCC9071452.1 tail fiber protein [Flavobacterium sp. F-65]